VNKTFTHHAGTTHSSKKEAPTDAAADDRYRRTRHIIQQPDYMKLQNVSPQSRLVGDGGLRKPTRKAANADLGDVGP